MVIPEYQRRKLASSVVGTAGVDTSGQQIAQDVSRAAGQVAEVAGNLAVKRQESKDAALANKTLIDFDMAAEQASQKHADTYAEWRGDKFDRVKALETSLYEQYQTVADSMPSRGARDLFEKHAPGVIKSKLDMESSLADKNQAILAYNDTLDSVSSLGQMAEMVGKNGNLNIQQKVQETQKLLKKGDETYNAAYALLSPENREKLKNGIPEQISKSLLYANFDSNPQDTKAMLASGVFDKFLTTEDRKKLQTQSDVWTDRIKDKQRSEQRLAVESNQNDTFKGLTEDFAAGQGSLAALEKAHILGAGDLPGGIKEDQYKVLLDSQINPKREGTPVETAASLAQMADSFFAIGDGVNVKGDAPFQKVIQYRMDALKAHQVKAITDTQLGDSLALTQKVFQKGEADVVSQAHRNGATVWNYFKDWTGNYFDFRYKNDNGKMEKVKITKEEFDGAKAFLGQELMSYMGKTDIPPDKINTVAQSILAKYVMTKHPELAGKTEIPNIIMDAETSFRNLYGGQTSYKPDFTVGRSTDTPKKKHALGEIITVADKTYRVTGFTPEGKTEMEDITNDGGQ